MNDGVPVAPAPGDLPAHALPAVGRPGGADLSSAVYGSLLVLTLVAAQARSDAPPEFIVATLLVAVGVFWLAELWSEVVNHRMRGGITRADLFGIARNEAPMLLAAILPALALATATLGLSTPARAVDLALLTGVLQLFGWGLAVGWALDRGWGVALLIATVDCAIGLLIVVLKVIVLH